MKEIVILGLGPSRHQYLTREAWKYLHSKRPLYVRTLDHPAARYLAKTKNIRSFDRLYEDSADGARVYRAVAGCLLRAARHYGSICYAVPGHPLDGEETVQMLQRLAPRLGVAVKTVAGMSLLEPLLHIFKLDLRKGVKICDARSLDHLKEPCPSHLVIARVHDRLMAAGVKRKLLELYPADYPVFVVRLAGRRKERPWKIKLGSLDRCRLYNRFTVIYLPPYRGYLIGDVLEIMARLRAANGCPWDRQQTNRSLRQYLVEEAYEVLGAIDSGDDGLLKEELGDVLLQVVFHSRIAQEEGRFDFLAVIDEIASKLIRRHPHVFGQDYAADAPAVKLLWEQIKADERNNRGGGRGKGPHNELSIDHSLPALLKAYKVQKKAAEVGFDWPCVQGPLQKAREELAELEDAFKAGEQAAIEEELGDYLFTVVNLARFLGVNPELALGKTIGKFMDRFRYVLEQAEKTGRPASDFSLEQLDEWWEKAKKIRKKGK